jgi:hypothetical protein
MGPGKSNGPEFHMNPSANKSGRENRHPATAPADLDYRLANAFADAVCRALHEVACSWACRASRAKRAESVDRVGDAMRSLAANTGLFRKFVSQEASARLAARTTRLAGATSHPHEWILAGMQADSHVQLLESLMIDHYMQSELMPATSELAALYGGHAASANDDAGHDSLNPLGPRMLAEALLAALAPFGAQPHIRLSLFRAFVPMLDDILRQSYTAAAQHSPGNLAGSSGHHPAILSRAYVHASRAAAASPSAT